MIAAECCYRAGKFVLMTLNESRHLVSIERLSFELDSEGSLIACLPRSSPHLDTRASRSLRVRMSLVGWMSVNSFTRDAKLNQGTRRIRLMNCADLMALANVLSLW